MVEELDPKQGQVGFKQLPLLDSGDFVEAEGTVIKTKTGEIYLYFAPLTFLIYLSAPVAYLVDFSTSFMLNCVAAISEPGSRYSGTNSSSGRSPMTMPAACVEAGR